MNGASSRAKPKLNRQLAAVQRDLQLPPTALNHAELRHYTILMESLPSEYRAHTGVQVLVANAAQCAAEIDNSARLIDEMGQILPCKAGWMANPAVGIRDRAQKRMAFLLTRVRALPAGNSDSREAQRAAAHERNFRNGAGLVLVAPAAEDETVDWTAELQATQ